MKHRWTVGQPDGNFYDFEVFPHGSAVTSNGFNVGPAERSFLEINLANEVLRLARRERDLITRANEALSVLGHGQAPFAEAVHVLAAEAERRAKRDAEHEIFATEMMGVLGLDREAIDLIGEPVGNAILQATCEVVQREADHLAVIRRQEEQLSRLQTIEQRAGEREAKIEELSREVFSWRHVAANRSTRILSLEQQLAKEAEHIREMDTDVVSLRESLKEAWGHAAKLESEVWRLNRKVLAGAAETPAVNDHAGRLAELALRINRLELDSDGLAELRGRMSRLEIARETLGRRLDQVDEAVERLGSATQPAGQPPAYARLDSLEASRRDHAIMLTGHEDRLRTVEEAADRFDRANSTGNPTSLRDALSSLGSQIARLERRENAGAQAFDALNRSMHERLTDHADRMNKLESMESDIRSHVGALREIVQESLAPRVSDLEAAAGSPAWTKSDLDALLNRVIDLEGKD